MHSIFATAHGPAGLVTDSRREDAPTDGAGLDDALIPRPRRPEPSSPAGSASRALLTITIDHRWLREAVGHGTLDSEAPTDVHTVRRWACDAEVLPVVLGTSSEPLDIGRRTRTVPEAIRRALSLRDGGCAFPGCTRRPRRCHAHHEHWHVEMIDGRPWFTPPPWIDPEQRPRRGGRSAVPVAA